MTGLCKHIVQLRLEGCLLVLLHSLRRGPELQKNRQNWPQRAAPRVALDTCPLQASLPSSTCVPHLPVCEPCCTLFGSQLLVSLYDTANSDSWKAYLDSLAKKAPEVVQLFNGYSALNSIGVRWAHSHFLGRTIGIGAEKTQIWPEVRVMMKPRHLDNHPLLPH